MFNYTDHIPNRMLPFKVSIGHRFVLDINIRTILSKSQNAMNGVHASQCNNRKTTELNPHSSYSNSLKS